eukprot:11203631-Lingulodinium_polyedra.AAC.1
MMIRFREEAPLKADVPVGPVFSRVIVYCCMTVYLRERTSSPPHGPALPWSPPPPSPPAPGRGGGRRRPCPDATASRRPSPRTAAARARSQRGLAGVLAEPGGPGLRAKPAGCPVQEEHIRRVGLMTGSASAFPPWRQRPTRRPPATGHCGPRNPNGSGTK